MTVRGSSARSLSCSIAGLLTMRFNLGDLRGAPAKDSYRLSRELPAEVVTEEGFAQARSHRARRNRAGQTTRTDSAVQCPAAATGGGCGRLRRARAVSPSRSSKHLRKLAHTRSRPHAHTHARARTHTRARARTKARAPQQEPFPFHKQQTPPTRPQTYIGQTDTLASSISIIGRFSPWGLGRRISPPYHVICGSRACTPKHPPTRTAARTRKGAHAAQRAHARARTHRGRTHARTEAIARGGDCRRRHAGASRAPACLSMQAPVRPATCARARARRRIATAPGG